MTLPLIRYFSLHACPPEPQGIGRPESAGLAVEVHRMVPEQFEALFHHAEQHVIRTLRQIVCDLPLGDVVRRRQDESRRCLMPDQQMPVRTAPVEMQRLRTERLRHRPDQFRGLGGRDLIAAVIYHGLLLVRLFLGKRHQIAAERVVGVEQVHTDAGRLERRTARIIYGRVVTHDRQVGHVAARRHAFGHRLDQSHFAVRGQVVDHRLVCQFERGLAAQHFMRFVGHAVTEYDNIFHAVCMLSIPVRTGGAEAVRRAAVILAKLHFFSEAAYIWLMEFNMQTEDQLFLPALGPSCRHPA